MPSAHRARVGWRACLDPQVARTGREHLLSASAHHCPSVSAQINICPGLDELWFPSGSHFPINRTVTSDEDPGGQTETSLFSSFLDFNELA